MQMISLHYSNNITILIALECEVLFWDLKPSYGCFCSLGNSVLNLASIEDGVQWHRSCVDFDFGSCSNMEKTWNCLSLAIELLIKVVTNIVVVSKEAKTKLFSVWKRVDKIYWHAGTFLNLAHNPTQFNIICSVIGNKAFVYVLQSRWYLFSLMLEKSRTPHPTRAITRKLWNPSHRKMIWKIAFSQDRKSVV